MPRVGLAVGMLCGVASIAAAQPAPAGSNGLRPLHVKPSTPELPPPDAKDRGPLLRGPRRSHDPRRRFRDPALRPPQRSKPSGFGGRHAGPLYEELPPELRRRVEDFIREFFPERFEELRQLDADAPEVFQRKVNRLLPQVLRLIRLHEEDPESFPLHLEELRISMRIRLLARRSHRWGRGRPFEQERLEELRRLLEERFELRQQLHAHEIERLEQRLAEAREMLERRAMHKDTIIQRDLDDVLSGGLRPPAAASPQPRRHPGPAGPPPTGDVPRPRP